MKPRFLKTIPFFRSLFASNRKKKTELLTDKGTIALIFKSAPIREDPDPYSDVIRTCSPGEEFEIVREQDGYKLVVLSDTKSSGWIASCFFSSFYCEKGGVCYE